MLRSIIVEATGSHHKVSKSSTPRAEQISYSGPWARLGDWDREPCDEDLERDETLNGVAPRAGPAAVVVAHSPPRPSPGMKGHRSVCNAPPDRSRTWDDVLSISPPGPHRLRLQRTLRSYLR